MIEPPIATESSESLLGSDELDLRQIIKELWAGKWYILISTGITSTLAILWALSLPNMYTASALLAPTQSASGASAGFAQRYGGLASLAGISLGGGGGGSRTQLAIETLRSRAFIVKFVDKRNILPQLTAIEEWDFESGSIIFDTAAYDPTENKWINGGPDESRASSAFSAYRAFSKILNVSKDKQTGYVTLSITHQSPIAAAQWVTWLVEDINTNVKNQEVAEAKRSIEYLERQVSQTSLADLHALLFELIQSQTETIMLAEARPEFVFKTIDPAVVPEEKSAPRRSLICILGGLLGGAVGILFVLIRYYFKEDST